MTEEACWALLDQGLIGRLAVADDGAPDIFPVNYRLDGHSILLATNMGHKLLASRDRPVAFEVDHADPVGGIAWSVVIHGSAKEVPPEERVEGPVSWAGSKDYLLRVTAGGVSGRCFHIHADSGTSIG
jgi:nitroimidazol reductase NimA-like FMN-containing flavoprotein (pyridoxamine 5'-phosphate oxidase superfamily)